MAARPLPPGLRARSAFVVARARLCTEVVIAPAGDGAAPDQLEIARRAFAMRVVVPLRQSEKTQHGLPTRRTERSNKVRVVTPQRIGSWPGIPERIRRILSLRRRQMGKQMLHFLPQGPVEADSSFERGDEILELFAPGAAGARHWKSI